jgi:hypothetical protein
MVDSIISSKKIDEADIPNGSIVMFDGNVYGIVDKPDTTPPVITNAAPTHTDSVLTVASDNTIVFSDATATVTSLASEPTLILGSTPFTEKDLKEILKHIREHMDYSVTLHADYDHTHKEISLMWNYWNILIVMVICIVTVKLVIPKLNLKNFAKLFVKVIYWPVKRFEKACEGFDKEVNSLVKNTKVKK